MEYIYFFRLLDYVTVLGKKNQTNFSFMVTTELARNLFFKLTLQERETHHTPASPPFA